MPTSQPRRRARRTMAGRWSAMAAGTMLVGLCSGCRPAPPESLAGTALRDSLRVAVARDQEVRDSLTATLRRTGRVDEATARAVQRADSLSQVWLVPWLRAHGLPRRADVGPDGVEMTMLLLQHADRVPGLQQEMLPRVREAFGRGDIAGQDLALYVDRVLRGRGEPQRYGTQAAIVDGRVVFDPIVDSIHVDERRQALGLPTLAVYRRLMDSIYGATPGRGTP